MYLVVPFKFIVNHSHVVVLPGLLVPGNVAVADPVEGV